MVKRNARPAPPSLAALEKVSPVALFLDFDGTLVDLAATPDSISPRSGIAELLSNLNKRLAGRFALISGRSIADIESHIGPVPFAIAGSHGADKRLANGEFLGPPARSVSEKLLGEIRSFAHQHGLNLEEKSHGVALHFRANPELENIAIEFARDTAQESGLSTKMGKCVVELVQSEADKGTAVDAFMHEAQFRAATPWFVGDDVTDEDGFAACISRAGGAILVGEREESCATHALPSVAAVHDWLEFE